MSSDQELSAFLTARLVEDEAAAKTARALREVEAKRALIREHGIRDGRCRVCTAIHEDRAKRFRAPCWTLLFIAEVYSDHPDYREEWAPWLVIIEPGHSRYLVSYIQPPPNSGASLSWQSKHTPLGGSGASAVSG